ncbi:hypothetical protein [Cellulomonas hominis]|uniref:hypothetical protein n=1 Tax=Cellulomonas hominis TaxID=156981 RepID=UPI00144478A1|nr:hypothetical protein [Cellulomonas hominis]NKY08838.1 hypothetical protein [Cellulomonas hominis]
MMDGHTREALASNGALELPSAACKELTQQWTARERLYSVETFHIREAALADAREVCDTCVVLDSCRDLARYTGLAAGNPYRFGQVVHRILGTGKKRL